MEVVAVWSYILKSLNYAIRDDLAVNIDKEFASDIFTRNKYLIKLENMTFDSNHDIIKSNSAL